MGTVLLIGVWGFAAFAVFCFVWAWTDTGKVIWPEKK